MKRTAIILLVLLLIALFVAVFAYINQEKLIERFIEHQTSNAVMRYELLDSTEYDMQVVTVGTSAPLPSDRVQSCTAVFVNGRFFIFDIGEGALDKMEDLRLPIDRVEAVLITHWHTDHYIDLPGLVNRSWLLGRDAQLAIYGPEGIDEIAAGIDALLHIDEGYRVEHHGEEIVSSQAAGIMPFEIDARVDSMEVVVYDNEGIRISAISVSHHPVEAAVAYKVTYNGKSLVISGDTAYDEELIPFAMDADILIHEAIQKDLLVRAAQLQRDKGSLRNAKILTDILDYHTSPAEAATIAQKANVKKLILNHLAPVPENPISRRMYTSGLDEIYGGPVLLAEDGDIYRINKI